jgi:cell division protein FtsL
MDSQSLQVFQQFVEFVKNIDNYEATVGQIKAATDAYNAAVDKITQAQTLDQFRAKLDVLQSNLDFERDEFTKSCQAQNDVLAQRVKDLDAREQVLNDMAVVQAQRKIDLSMQETSLTAKAFDLVKKEQDLNTQIDTNNQVAQDLSSRLALIKQAGA